MAVFNSLGSNYSSKFVWRSLFGLGSSEDKKTIQDYFQQRYNGAATFTYKGRQALELALRRSNLPAGSKVGINGFTCYVVYQAIENAGLKPVFIDVADGQLHFGLKELKEIGELQAVVVQNTLGLPADMTSLENYCQKNKMIIVEDLAHSMGAVYEDGREAGTVGQLTMLSFSQDKPMDVVAGGAFIDRRDKALGDDTNFPNMSLWQQTKNRWYPFWTGLIRSTYSFGLGRYIHFVLKKLHWLATPMSDNLQGLHHMTPLAQHLLTTRLDDQTDELVHRRNIAAIYHKELPAEILFPELGEPSYLRFPIKSKSRRDLVEALKKSGIYIGDTWYDAPIAPKRYLEKTSYQPAECPRAELLAERIVNLPTHQHVSEDQARSICAIINKVEQIA